MFKPIRDFATLGGGIVSFQKKLFATLLPCYLATVDCADSPDRMVFRRAIMHHFRTVGSKNIRKLLTDFAAFVDAFTKNVDSFAMSPT